MTSEEKLAVPDWFREAMKEEGEALQKSYNAAYENALLDWFTELANNTEQTS